MLHQSFCIPETFLQGDFNRLCVHVKIVAWNIFCLECQITEVRKVTIKDYNVDCSASVSFSLLSVVFISCRNWKIYLRYAVSMNAFSWLRQLLPCSCRRFQPLQLAGEEILGSCLTVFPIQYCSSREHVALKYFCSWTRLSFEACVRVLHSCCAVVLWQEQSCADRLLSFLCCGHC